MSELKPSLKKNILLNSAYQILSVITPFITAPYVSRVLGVEQIGVNSYTNSIVAYFSMFAILGTVIYGTREISRNRENKEEYSKLFWEIELLSIFLSLTMVALWIGFIFFAPQYKTIYIILTLTLLSNLFDISWLYSGLEQYKYTVSKNCAVKITGVVLVLTLVKKPEHLWIFVLISSGSTLLGNMSMWLTLPKFVQRVNISQLRVWRHLRHTLVYFIPTIAGSIYHQLDKLLLGIITKETSYVGFYEQANKILTLVKTLCYSSIATVMGSRISYLYEQKLYTEVKHKIYKSMDVVMFLSIGACFGLLGIANNFIPAFFGEGYEPSILLLRMLAPTLFIIGISTCLSNTYYVPAGLRSKSCFFEIAGAVINLILNLLLIPHLTSVGAVIGTLAAEFLISFLYIFFARKFFSFKDWFKCTYKKFISAVPMLVFIFGFDFLNRHFEWGLHLYLLLAIQIIGGGGLYLMFELLMKDLKYVQDMAKKILNRFRKK